ncbi:MAG: family 2 glycosyl transferase, partial [Paracoccaceae bacterium]
GYSQIANPVYLIGKGTIGRKRARDLMLRNMASNLRGTLRPVAWADYRGRLIGNLLAIRDILLRRSDPERVLSL